MKIIQTNFKDLIIIKNDTYNDKRGYFKELLRETLVKKKFPFQVMSFSKKKCNQGSAFTTKKNSGKIYIGN